MTIARIPPPLTSDRILSRDQMRNAIEVLTRRLNEIDLFNVASVASRGDPHVERLRLSINDSLSLIFGRGTPRFDSYSVSALMTMPLRVEIVPSATPTDFQRALTEGLELARQKLMGLVDRLREEMSLLPEQIAIPAVDPEVRVAVGNAEIFIVHGRDEALRLKVEMLFQSQGFNTTVLADKPGMGKTIIEKFEAHADAAGYAVVLMTGDDFGYLANETGNARPRARQNVILELGYFYAKLGRARVHVLNEPNVEWPSDILGVAYTSVDPSGAWRFALLNELAAAGFTVDLNKVIKR
jgi:predicted nucleotide-binding protein